MATSSSTARRYRADDVRDAALTLFADRGYHGTAMSDIAGVLGVRVPTLYSHIPGKQDLLAAIVVKTTNVVWEEYEAAVAGHADPDDRLQRAVEVYALRHATHRREALVVNRDATSLDEPLRAEVLALRERHAHAVRDLITDGVERGAFAVPSASIASFAILEMSVSIARWFRESGPLTAGEVAREHSLFALRIAGTGPLGSGLAGT
jgi:AcrR family transcriptional regulator